MRVFLGPSHAAGVLWGYKKGLSELGVDSRVVVFAEHPFKYPADVTFRLKGNYYLRTMKRISIIPRLLANFDIFHFVWGSSLFPHPYNIDVPFLKLLRKKIVMSFLGSDIRCSEGVLTGLKDSFNCHECEIGYEGSERQHACKVEKKIRLVKFWARNAGAIFSGIGYSEILDILGIKYHPLILPCDLNYWKPFKTNSLQKREGQVLILHAPSEKRIKGEKFVVGAVRKLQSEGFNANLILLTNVPNSEVRNWLNVADIVVDQLLGGWHGMFAVESMAMAKPTICYINEKYKSRFTYAKNIPLVNSSPFTIYEKLKTLIENPRLRETIAHRSRKYVEEVHACKKVSEQLLEVYKSI